jgi:hypothetical protein
MRRAEPAEAEGGMLLCTLSVSINCVYLAGKYFK